MHRSRRSRKRPGFTFSLWLLAFNECFRFGKCTFQYQRRNHESSKNKKRPERFSSGRLGSPPPELPNHELDSRRSPHRCKRHFGNSFISRSHIENGGGSKVWVTAKILEMKSTCRELQRKQITHRKGTCRGQFRCQVAPPSLVLQLFRVLVITLPLRLSANSTPTMSSVRDSPPAAGVTCVQCSPLSDE
jgi:hypothetical protein